MRESSRRNSAKVRGVSRRVFAEFLREISRRRKMVCASLREISRSFIRESSLLRIFVRGVNAKKELFSWADLYYPKDILRLHTRFDKTKVYIVLCLQK